MPRSKSSAGWMREHLRDPFVKRANAEGLRSRAAYKLSEIAARDRLLAPGMVVVDLGAAPGGWSQVAIKAVGNTGLVIAVDLLELPAIPRVKTIRGDFHEDETLARVTEALEGRSADLVLSDMAPNLSGIASADQARSIALAELALEFALRVLKPDGNFLVKTFHGAGYEAFVADLRRAFHDLLTRKPEASRSRSREVYLLGKRPKIARNGAARGAG